MFQDIWAKEEAYFVYALCDPDSGQPFYVGFSKLKRSRKNAYRPREHIWEAKGQAGSKANHHKLNTIRAILQRGKEPLVRELAYAPTREMACKVEERFIYHYGRKSEEDSGLLTNLTSGGTGAPDLSPEAKARAREKRKAFRHTPEAKEKIRQAGLKRKHSEETKKKIRESTLRSKRKTYA